MDKKSLVEFISEKMQQYGNRDYKIQNVRIFNANGNVDALADISYKWSLHSWEKSVEKKDMIFIYRDGQWKSPLLH